MRNKIIKVFYTILIINMLAIFLASISSCKKQNDNEYGEINVTDSTGEIISFNESPKSVVILESSFACIWKLAGGIYSGIPSNYKEYEINGVALSLDGAKEIGDYKHPQGEAVLSCAPDLIIYSSKSTMTGHIELIETIKSSGYPCKFYGVNIDSFEDYLYTLEQFTKITKRDDLYQINGLNVKTQIDNVIKKAENKVGPEVVLVRPVSGKVKVLYDNHITVTMLKDLNATLIDVSASSSNLIISMEKVITFNPKYIFYVFMGDVENGKKAIKNQISDTNEWKSLEEKGTILKELDQNLFNRIPNNNWGEAYERLYEYLYK